MEEILKKIRQEYIDNGIWRSIVAVIDKLLARETEMREVYEELASKLTPLQQEHFWDAALSISTFWNPTSSRNLRENQKQLIDLNKQIATCASKLADLMASREELAEKSGLHAYSDYDLSSWINRATDHNHRYRTYLKPALEPLFAQYDSKYWPTNVEIMRAVAEYADEAEVTATDDWTEELLSSPKHSKADHLRALLKAIDTYKDLTGPIGYVLPKSFQLSDKSLATIINCSVDLPPDEMVDALYVKRARQNIRERKNREN